MKLQLYHDGICFLRTLSLCAHHFRVMASATCIFLMLIQGLSCACDEAVAIRRCGGWHGWSVVSAVAFLDGERQRGRMINTTNAHILSGNIRCFRCLFRASFLIADSGLRGDHSSCCNLDSIVRTMYLRSLSIKINCIVISLSV